MAETELKVGIISCSGEDVPEGTISRLATRRVLELLRPGQTVTLCLPLFLAGGEGERAFARDFPTITVDGCSKQCARRGTEMHSGPVSAALVITELLPEGHRGSGRVSTRATDGSDEAAVQEVARVIAEQVDAILASPPHPPTGESAAASSCGCGCGTSLPVGAIEVGGQSVTIPGLPLMLQQCAQEGVMAEAADAAERLVQVVGIYHPIPDHERSGYARALLAAYRDFLESRRT